MANQSLPTGRWVHLAATFDGTIMRLYMDGRQVGILERPGKIGRNDRNIIIGNYDVDHEAYFVGTLDEVRLYDRALSPDEIAAHAALGGTQPPDIPK